MIAPISYAPAENGVAVSVELAEKEAKIIALVPDVEPARRRKCGETISLCKFHTVVESWGPDPDAAVPTQSKKTVLDFGEQLPGRWNDLPATAEQLQELDVDGMQHVSGRGTYTAGFSLPACDGAELTVETGDCMVVAGRVNGKPLPPVNQRSGKVDLTGLVHGGENTLELTIATTLINRLRIAHPLFDGKGGLPAPPQPAEGDPDSHELIIGTLSDEDYELPGAPMDMPAPGSGAYAYGVYAVTVTPYMLIGN